MPRVVHADMFLWLVPSGPVRETPGYLLRRNPSLEGRRTFTKGEQTVTYQNSLTLVDKLKELVRWLSMPYAGGRPIFATALPNGQLLDTGLAMQALWDEVNGYDPDQFGTMSGTVTDERNTQVTGAWMVCPHCGSRTVTNEVSIR